MCEPIIRAVVRPMHYGVGPDLIQGPENERVVVFVDDVPVEDFAGHWRNVARREVARSTDIEGSAEPPKKMSHCRIENAETKARIVEEGGPMLCCRECARRERQLSQRRICVRNAPVVGEESPESPIRVSGR